MSKLQNVSLQTNELLYTTRTTFVTTTNTQRPTMQTFLDTSKTLLNDGIYGKVATNATRIQCVLGNIQSLLPRDIHKRIKDYQQRKRPASINEPIGLTDLQWLNQNLIITLTIEYITNSHGLSNKFDAFLDQRQELCYSPSNSQCIWLIFELMNSEDTSSTTSPKTFPLVCAMCNVFDLDQCAPFLNISQRLAVDNHHFQITPNGHKQSFSRLNPYFHLKPTSWSRLWFSATGSYYCPSNPTLQNTNSPPGYLRLAAIDTFNNVNPKLFTTPSLTLLTGLIGQIFWHDDTTTPSLILPQTPTTFVNTMLSSQQITLQNNSTLTWPQFISTGLPTTWTPNTYLSAPLFLHNIIASEMYEPNRTNDPTIPISQAGTFLDLHSNLPCCVNTFTPLLKPSMNVASSTTAFPHIQLLQEMNYSATIDHTNANEIPYNILEWIPTLQTTTSLRSDPILSHSLRATANTQAPLLSLSQLISNIRTALTTSATQTFSTIYQQFSKGNVSNNIKGILLPNGTYLFHEQFPNSSLTTSQKTFLSACYILQQANPWLRRCIELPPTFPLTINSIWKPAIEHDPNIPLCVTFSTTTSNAIWGLNFEPENHAAMGKILFHSTRFPSNTYSIRQYSLSDFPTTTSTYTITTNTSDTQTSTNSNRTLTCTNIRDYLTQLSPLLTTAVTNPLNMMHWNISYEGTTYGVTYFFLPSDVDILFLDLSNTPTPNFFTQTQCQGQKRFRQAICSRFAPFICYKLSDPLTIVVPQYPISVGITAYSTTSPTQTIPQWTKDYFLPFTQIRPNASKTLSNHYTNGTTLFNIDANSASSSFPSTSNNDNSMSIALSGVLQNNFSCCLPPNPHISFQSTSTNITLQLINNTSHSIYVANPTGMASCNDHITGLFSNASPSLWNKYWESNKPNGSAILLQSTSTISSASFSYTTKDNQTRTIPYSTVNNTTFQAAIPSPPPVLSYTTTPSTTTSTTVALPSAPHYSPSGICICMSPNQNTTPATATQKITQTSFTNTLYTLYDYIWRVQFFSYTSLNWNNLQTFTFASSQQFPFNCPPIVGPSGQLLSNWLTIVSANDQQQNTVPTPRSGFPFCVDPPTRQPSLTLTIASQQNVFQILQTYMSNATISWQGGSWKINASTSQDLTIAMPNETDRIYFNYSALPIMQLINNLGPAPELFTPSESAFSLDTFAKLIGPITFPVFTAPYGLSTQTTITNTSTYVNPSTTQPPWFQNTSTNPEVLYNLTCSNWTPLHALHFEAVTRPAQYTTPTNQTTLNTIKQRQNAHLCAQRRIAEHRPSTLQSDNIDSEIIYLSIPLLDSQSINGNYNQFCGAFIPVNNTAPVIDDNNIGHCSRQFKLQGEPTENVVPNSAIDFNTGNITLNGYLTSSQGYDFAFPKLSRTTMSGVISFYATTN